MPDAVHIKLIFKSARFNGGTQTPHAIGSLRIGMALGFQSLKLPASETYLAQGAGKANETNFCLMPGLLGDGVFIFLTPFCWLLAERRMAGLSLPPQGCAQLSCCRGQANPGGIFNVNYSISLG